MLALVFQVGNDRLALDVRSIREVIPRVRLQSLTGSPNWLAGGFVYRGQVVPVLDLHRLAGLGACPASLNSRIILVPHPGEDEKKFLGLLASHVTDLQEVETSDATRMHLRLDAVPDFGSAIVDRGEVLRLFDLEKLLPASIRDELSNVTRRRQS